MATPEPNYVRTDLRALLGEQVWQACVDMEITQAEMAALLGVSEKHLSHVIHGLTGKPPFFDRVAKVAGKRWEVRLVDL